MFGKKRGRYGVEAPEVAEVVPDVEPLACGFVRDGFTGESYSVRPEDGFDGEWDLAAELAAANEKFTGEKAPGHPEFARDLDRELGYVRDMLLHKNLAYGDSALDPVRVLSSSDPSEQIRVRMDDKLSRMMRGDEAGEDALMDFVGYYFLLKIAEHRS